jgi:hypothetical protein
MVFAAEGGIVSSESSGITSKAVARTAIEYQQQVAQRNQQDLDAPHFHSNTHRLHFWPACVVPSSHVSGKVVSRNE